MLAGTLSAGAVLPGAAAAAPDPADQPPFGGAAVAPFDTHEPPEGPPPGYTRDPAQVIAIADATDAVRDERAERDLRPKSGTRGPGVWQVSYVDPERVERARVIVDDRSGEVIEALAGRDVGSPLARGYDGAVAGIANRAYVWIPLCLIFLIPFFDPRRPFRLLHLDLLVLLSFGVSQFFFNRGEIEVSVPLVYPVLAYFFVRMLSVGMRSDGMRERREKLVPWMPKWALVAAIALLAALHVSVNLAEDNVIDVGYAGVVGADRLADGDDIYDRAYWQGLEVRGEVYGPVNYLAYVPFEQAFPWDGEWDDLPAARAAAIAFSLLTALVLILLGRRLRGGEEGRMLGWALGFAWLAYPYSLYTVDSSFNDALVSLSLAATLLVFASPAGRGALSALGGLTKYGTLALAPLFAAGTGERRVRSTIAFGVAFAIAAAAVVLPLLPDGGPRELYDSSFGYQASRGSPFSLWGLEPSLEPLQDAIKALAVVLALLFFFVPRRRSVFQVAALGAVLLIVLQAAATHWLYPYAVWFAPLVFVALFSAYRGQEMPIRASGEPDLSTPG